MLKVVFWNDAFLPDGPNATTCTRYSRSNPRNASGARDVPDELEPFLPKSAQIVGRTDEKPAPKKKYTNPAHDLDPQHVSDVLARKREEEEKEANAKAEAEGLTIRVTGGDGEGKAPAEETELEKAIREAEEKRVAEEAANKAALDQAPAGAPAKKRGK